MDMHAGNPDFKSWIWAIVGVDPEDLSGLDHFVADNKMIGLAKGAQWEVDDIALTRYACYLIARSAKASQRSSVGTCSAGPTAACRR